MDKKAEQSEELKRYKSPKRILLRFFEKSRNKWKAKCKEGKYQIKLLQNKIRYLKKNKEILKDRLKAVESELDEIKAKAKHVSDKTEQLKKKF
jgi:chromosome segregation ATPase